MGRIRAVAGEVKKLPVIISDPEEQTIALRVIPETATFPIFTPSVEIVLVLNARY